MGIGVNVSYCGWDSGYDTCKLITNQMKDSNQKPLTFPSLAKERTTSLIDKKELGLGQSFSKEKMLIEVQDKNDEWYDFMVGDYIVNQLESGGSNYEVNKYQSEEELAKLLAGLSTLYPNANRIYIDKLVTGLPIQHHRNHKKGMKERFEGKFKSKITARNGKEVTVRYTINDIVVVPQAAGALLYYLNQDNNADIMRDKIAIIDVGGRTTDGLAYNCGEIINESPFSSDIGMSNVFRAVSNNLNIDENLIRSAVVNQQDTITYNQEEKSIRDIVNKCYQELAREIFKATRNEWRDFISLINQILIVGGGAKLLAPFLKKEFGRIGIQAIPNPQLANVLGYLLRAETIYNKEQKE
ncbi:actin-like ATPase involved in cell division [Halobacteroides halobius DSM 5150]|uniref:Actin-like ATPase involved in cell division n=1 Tax=Halobacteroides halobius (strain ATCC 35273 / DSM 5150 / MD-1) TaxID=748449 RepID=L0K6A1_HALHC|nr:ParM/StbA family protein [Halobacteroides halobius]AGB40065.1 actin-like ATPase involved in cell division [Halobacteroides halobius DSM 5150]